MRCSSSAVRQEKKLGNVLNFYRKLSLTSLRCIVLLALVVETGYLLNSFRSSCAHWTTFPSLQTIRLGPCDRVLANEIKEV